jgi:hypothetical protein
VRKLSYNRKESMRIFYSIVILFFAFTFTTNGQSREDYDIQGGQFDAKAVHIFPNPAVDFVHVRLDKIDARQITVTLHNIIGNEIKVDAEVVDEHEIRVKVKDLDTGYYLIALKDHEERFRGTYKFVKR